MSEKHSPKNISNQSCLRREEKTRYKLNSNSIRKVIPDNIAFVVRKHEAGEGELYAEEARHIKNAIQARKDEFLAGRIAARKAMAQLGCEPCVIPVGANRQPLWPQHIIGSITHDGEHCIAAVAGKKSYRSLGIDLTINSPINGDLIDLICTKKELNEIKSIGESNFVTDPYKLVFSLKESTYKCLFPFVGRIFDFQDVDAIIKPGTETASIVLGNDNLFSHLDLSIKARYTVTSDYIFSIVWTCHKPSTRTNPKPLL